MMFGCFCKTHHKVWHMLKEIRLAQVLASKKEKKKKKKTIRWRREEMVRWFYAYSASPYPHRSVKTYIYFFKFTYRHTHWKCEKKIPDTQKCNIKTEDKTTINVFSGVHFFKWKELLEKKKQLCTIFKTRSLFGHILTLVDRSVYIYILLKLSLPPKHLLSRGSIKHSFTNSNTFNLCYICPAALGWPVRWQFYALKVGSQHEHWSMTIVVM